MHKKTTSSAVSDAQPALRAVHMGLFPTLDNIQSVVDMAMSQLPIMTPNALRGVLMTYHNTLLKQLQKENTNVR